MWLHKEENWLRAHRKGKKEKYLCRKENEKNMETGGRHNIKKKELEVTDNKNQVGVQIYYIEE
jgi:hypothetical protein